MYSRRIVIIMAKEERIYLRVSKETKEKFQTLIENTGKKPSEMFVEMLDSYQENFGKYRRLEERLDIQDQSLGVIYEYLTLLVKGNPNLPTDEDKMKKFVNAESRFKKFIEAKEKKK